MSLLTPVCCFDLDSKNQRERNFHIETINDDLEIDQSLIEFCKRNYSSDISVSSYIESLPIKEFYLRQYMNFIDCYRKFLEEDKIHSMIYFSNRYIKDEFMNNNLNYKYLMHLLIELINDIEPKNDYIKNLKCKVKEFGKSIIDIQKKEHLFFVEYKKGHNVLCRLLDIMLFAIQIFIGLLVTYLVVFSKQIPTEWNWLIIAFNPLPILLWMMFRHKRVIKRIYLMFTMILVLYSLCTPFSPQLIYSRLYLLMAAFALRTFANGYLNKKQNEPTPG